MGVSISWYPVDPHPRDITPGPRSMMHQLLLDNSLYGQLGKSDIPVLLKLGRGSGGEIQKAFQALARALRKHGSIIVTYDF